MSLPTEDDDMLRRTEIEEMMRSDRARYFRDEPVQQEYRDILGRIDDRATALKLAQPGRFDIALANYKAQKLAASGESPAEIRQRSFVPSADLTTVRPDKPELVRVAQIGRSDSGAVSPTRVPDTPFLLDGVDRVEEMQSKLAKARTGPIQFTLKDQLNYAAQKTGLQVEVHEGGQPAKGEPGPREGSTRHDHGGAADLKLVEIADGRKRYLRSDNHDDKRKMYDFIAHVVTAGATGVGHAQDYMGPSAIHVGGGDSLVWGARGESANALPWVVEAHAKGLAARQKLLKDGAWMVPQKLVQFIPKQNDELDVQEMTNGDGRLLSMMRNMLNADMMLRKKK